MPPMTHFMGPAIDDGEGSANTRFLQRWIITRELLGKLPAVAHFSQKLHRGITDVLAFQAEGYDSSVQFTHEIAPQTEDAVWSAMRDKTRNMVRKAHRHFEGDTIDDPDAFIRLYNDNLSARGKISEIRLPVSRAIITACLERACGRIYVARQADGVIAAAAFCAWDQQSSYYLMSTRTVGSGNSASSLILWNAVKDAMTHGLIFDCDGVISAGAILFYAGFGASIHPRYIVSRSGKVMRLVNTVRTLTRSKSKFF